MKLYEFEGHNILARAGIDVPFFVVVNDLDEVKQARKRLKFPIVAKVQVLAGGRSKAGGVKICRNQKQLLAFARDMLSRDFLGETVRFILLAQKVKVENEYYFSVTYDTAKKIPFLMFSEAGGIEIEELQKKYPDTVKRVDIDPIVGPKEKDLRRIFGKDSQLCDLAMRLWDAFWRFDCRLVEVNPVALVSTAKAHPRGVQSRGQAHPGGDHRLVALDAKVILDDAGLIRHRDLAVLPKGTISAIPTDRELAARQIDAQDYRGTAGSVFIEFAGGDIAVLASGGGASLLLMDALIAAGGKPANYTEYSGNPPGEKVEKLTKVTLSREGLCGCLVAGAVANFTDIYETLSGFVRGLKSIKPQPTYPIVIRRGGPRQEQAYKMLEKVRVKDGFDIHLFGPETPISVACQQMAELSCEF